MSTPEEFHIDLQNLKDAIVDRVIVMKLANAGLAIIRERTLSGKFLPGSSPGAEDYSTKPFARPLAGLTKQLRKDLIANGAEVFTKDGKQTWIVIKGGYKQMREIGGKDVSHVSMVWTGRMMRNLGILNTDDNSAVLGPKDEDTKKIVMYHNVLGAGKSKKKRVFMGFTESEKGRLSKLVGDEFLRKLNIVKV
ncbi:MAG: hypothetical protein ACOYNS_10405 [Bacteroidota bacterium]